MPAASIAVVVIVPHPFDKIFKFLTSKSGVEDLGYFPFEFIFDLNWR